MNMLREDNTDINYAESIDNPDIYGFKPLSENITPLSADFMFFELSDEYYNNNNKYISGLIAILCNILTYQCVNCIAIIIKQAN